MAAKHKTKAKTTSAPVETVTAYKGFDENWQCRGFQYAIGQTYTMDGEVKACHRGFHACEHPLDVFEYYQPADSRFAEVKLSGAMHRDAWDTKIAAASITVVAELSIADMVQRTWDWVRSRATAENRVHVAEDKSAAVATGAERAALATGWQSAVVAAGDQGAARATGIQSAALATGDKGVALAAGDQGVASVTGKQSAASAIGARGVAVATDIASAASATGWLGAALATGDSSVAVVTSFRGAALATGIRSTAKAEGRQDAALATGNQSAAEAAGDQSAALATGDQSAALATGDQSAALATGWRGAASATGIQSAALASGVGGRVSGKAGCAIFLVERIDDYGPDHGKIVWEFCGKAGAFGIAISDTGEVSGPHPIKPDTFYTLKGGKPVEVA